MKSRRSRGERPWWEALPDRELLDVRLCDLRVGIPGSPVEPLLDRLNSELARAGLRFRPYAWLSTHWFTPEGVTGFAVPFYLAHARLERLELRHTGEAEGAGKRGGMKLMRHEAGHAIDHAYRLHRRKSWRECFGRYGEPYRRAYAPRRESRHYVHNLEGCYAQSHPVEDFAETFAVWLAPGSSWRTRYAGWPALAKLEYVDRLMNEIAKLPPLVRTRERTESVARQRIRLREHHRRKLERYSGRNGPGEYLR